MKSKFFALVLTGLAAAAAVALTGCSDMRAVAVVNGQKITKGELDDRLEGQGGKNVLAAMVQQALVFQYATAQHIDVTDADISKRVQEIQSRFPPGQFEAIIKGQGLTLEDVKNIAREQLILEKAVDKTITVSDAAVKDYFDKNHVQFDTQPQVRARHILVKTKADADTVEAQLKTGANFADLAKKFSTDPGTKDKGGELGWFGKGQMVPAFQNMAFSLAPGQTSPPVQTPFGWHVIQVEEKKAGMKATLADSRDKVERSLKQVQEQQLIPGFMQQLRTQAKIDVRDPRFTDLFPPLPATPAPGTTPVPSKRR